MGLFLSSFLVLRTRGCKTTKVCPLSFAEHERNVPSRGALTAGTVLGPPLLLQQESSLVSLGVELQAAGPAEGEGVLLGQTRKAQSRAWLWGRGEGTMEPGKLPGKGMGQFWSSVVMSPRHRAARQERWSGEGEA